MAATTARKIGYFYVTAADKPGEGARVLGALRDGGVNLLAFHAFPTGPGQSQLDLVPADERALQDAAKKAKLKLSERKTLFLIEGDDKPGAIAEVLQKLSAAGANVTALDAVRAGQRYGGLLWVKPADVDKAAKALGAT
jgi:hypothetical protein